MVDLYRPLGNTDSYLDFLKLPERPTINLPKQLNGDTSTPRLHKMTIEQSLKDDDWTGACKDSVKLVEQTGGKGYHYYGVSNAIWGRNCMIDPIIFIPYKGSQVFNMTVPDYYVNIAVSFKCREIPVGIEICKQYVPKYVLLSRSELEAKYKELWEYKKKCNEGTAVGALENDPNITFVNVAGGRYLQRTLNILYKILQDALED